jgi:hypothetical protein
LGQAVDKSSFTPSGSVIYQTNKGERGKEGGGEFSETCLSSWDGATVPYREGSIGEGRGARGDADLVVGALAAHHVLLARSLQGRAGLHDTGEEESKDGDDGDARELHVLRHLGEMLKAVKKKGWEGD